MQTYLVIGASGNTGLETVKDLISSGFLEKGNKLRLVNRDSNKLKQSLGDHAKHSHLEFISGDVTNADQLKQAITGVDYVFITYPFTEDAPKVVSSIIEAAKQANVKHIVKLSATGANAESQLQVGKYHGSSDAVLQKSGVKYTIVKPSFFHSNLYNNTSGIKGRAYIATTNSDNVRPWIDVRDIGAFCAAVLKNLSAHENKEYEINGHAITEEGVAELFSKELGKEIKFVHMEQSVADEQNKQYGLSAWLINMLAELNLVVRNGWTVPINSNFKDVVGRDPIHLQQWIHENAAAFK